MLMCRILRQMTGLPSFASRDSIGRYDMSPNPTPCRNRIGGPPWDSGRPSGEVVAPRPRV